MRNVLLLSLVLLAVPAAAQDGDRAGAGSARREDTVFVMGDRPSFRFGELRLDLTTKLDVEMRNSPDVEVDAVEMEHGRIGLDGRFSDLFGFQVEADLSDEDLPWRDVYVELRKWRALRIRGGRFKIPFGQERLTSISDLDFAHRSIPTEALTPGRDAGVEVNGRLFDRRLNYMVGLFHGDGDGWQGDDERPARRTFAGRLAGTPFASSSRLLRRLELGGGFTQGDVPEGANGVMARTVNGYEAFAPLYVLGARQRLGVDASFAQGPVAIRGEYLQVRDERKRQGLGDEDLPAITARGWLVTASAFVVGGLRSNGTAPRTPLGGGGIGAVQLAFRLDSLAFVSEGPSDEALRNPRAITVLPNDVRGATFGVNWFPVRFVKVQLNLIRERLHDPERRPDPAHPWITGGLLRVQFAM